MVGGSFDGDEAISDTAADVLGYLRLKITVKRIFATAILCSPLGYANRGSG